MADFLGLDDGDPAVDFSPKKLTSSSDAIGIEGWLLKKSAPRNTKWIKRWCVLDGSSLATFEAEDRAVKKGAYLFNPKTTALCLRKSSAPGESPSYAKTHPFGFALDCNPEAGKNRIILYFDAKTVDSLESWLQAIAVAALGTSWQECDIVKMKDDCTSDSKPNYPLQAGQVAFVKQQDKDGDVLLDVNSVEQPQWMFRSRLMFLHRELDFGKKSAELVLVPQSEFIVHWALRIGNGSVSRVYEFEAEGAIIGKTTALDKGYELESKPLRGWTKKSHREIAEFTRHFAATNSYNVTGNDTFGGKNCQDFVVELCTYLAIDTEQLPARTAETVKAGLVIAGVAAGTALLASSLLSGRKDDSDWSQFADFAGLQRTLEV